MVKYLNQEEKQKSRFLWEEAFPEDSKEFCDYYYTEKTKDNRILALEENGEICAMVQLNPYQINVGNHKVNSEYIVGVATKGEFRKRGYMRQLLMQMFRDLYQEEMPFCYLMPAAAAIYEPFDFAYIYDQPKWVLNNEEELQKQTITSESGVVSEMILLGKATDWIDEWLDTRYEVYANRDQSYMLRLIKELESEGGDFNILYKEEQIVGIQCRWGRLKLEQRCLLTTDNLCRLVDQKPAIMARIISLKRMMNLISLKETELEEASICLEIIDPFIPENQGCFSWTLSKQRTCFEPCEKSKVEMSIHIKDLTQWLFGYHIPKELEAFTKKIQIFRGVFIDEVV